MSGFDVLWGFPLFSALQPMIRARGLPVSTLVPSEVYRFMQLFPQLGARRPSVEYVPVPYPASPRSEGGATR